MRTIPWDIKRNIDVEIFATSEKAGKGNDGWLNEVAEKFNREKMLNA